MDVFWQITIVEFLLNVAVFAAAVIAYGPMRAAALRLTDNPLIEEAATGALFGAATTLALLLPVHIAGGAATGGQTAMLVLAAPLSGVWAGLCAGLITVGSGIVMWSEGATLGQTMVVSSFVSVVLGIARRLLLDGSSQASHRQFAYRHMPLLGVLGAAGTLTDIAFYQGMRATWDAVLSVTLSSVAATVILGTMLLREKRRHIAERDLRESEERIRSIAENLPGFLFRCVVHTGEKIDFNIIRTPQFDFDCWRSEVTGAADQTVFQPVHPEDRAKLTDCVLAARRNGSGWTETVRMRTPGGPERWMHATALLRRTGAGDTVWDGIALDETDRISAESHAADLQARLRQSEKMEALGTLAGGVAHELNNLLQPILMMTELTLVELTEGSPHYDRLQKVVDAASKAAEIVQRILAFGRSDEASLNSLDISSVTREAIAFVRTILPSSIRLGANIDDYIGNVRGDRTQLTQVLINLATNARDAIGGKVGRVSISLKRCDPGSKTAAPRIGTLGNRAYAVITIQDSGAGMDEATIQRIFEPFFTTKDVGKGTGLGLSVTHGIITAHGGAIDVESTPGSGTSFSIYLPVEEAEVPLALAN